jgi:glycosyltransferase involved in cell wall biosynthesis
LGIGGQDKVVIMVARMIWPKGVREFVEAAELLKERRPGVHFLLVAPLEIGSPDAVPEAYVRGRERTGNLRWLGFQKDVRQLYAMSHLAVLPSFYKEGGYPRALLEPMAMGKPVITTDTDGCRGVVDHGRDGYLIPPKDSKSLMDAVEEMISDERKLAEFGNRARVKMVCEFDERVIVPSAIKALGFFDLTPTRVSTAGVGR